MFWRQTYRADVGLEVDRLVQLDQSQVVLVGEEVVVRVHHLLFGAPLDVRVGLQSARKVILSDANTNLS